MLPFFQTPSEAKFSNSKSALTNPAFLQEVTEDMLLSGTIKQVKTTPNYEFPFCFHKFERKKRLILDFRCVNDHL